MTEANLILFVATYGDDTGGRSGGLGLSRESGTPRCSLPWSRNETRTARLT